MRIVIGYMLDWVCRLSGHRMCHTWVGRKADSLLNGGK